ncbi:hypothetical protein L1987_57084 [Smallanthus sonchifolius]|uniref:Uncharacterized protein n=1 Tax=Smallanthus sonchifolius TaxID=185202 RepID=A0ACB9DCI4_9ASTR|nr:hypothetical protein L1987_57084 [Smallanthus sonchifolius]
MKLVSNEGYNQRHYTKNIHCKGFKLTKKSLWRSKPNCQAIAANRHASAANFANQPRHGFAMCTARLRCICSSCSTTLKFTEKKLGGC